VPAQELLEALPVDVSPAQAALLEGHLDDLAAYGFDIAPFGGVDGRATFLVRRAPAGLDSADIHAALSEMLDAAQEGGAGYSWEEQALFTVACHSAVRAGLTLSHDEMRDLVRQLERTDVPHTCPHGRPTMIHLSQAQLDRQFGRH
jgi:DNA mismatch repair protein MutL